MMIIKRGLALGMEYISINITIERSFNDIYLHHKPLSSQSRSHLYIFVLSLLLLHQSSHRAQSHVQLSTNKDRNPCTYVHYLLLSICYYPSVPTLLLLLVVLFFLYVVLGGLNKYVRRGRQ